MENPKDRVVVGLRKLDLSAVFWALGAWTIVSLVFSISLVLTANTADAQVTRIVDMTHNEGVVDMRPTGRETGLPIPRFVSLRNAKTNMRVGPGIEFELKAVYNRKGLPVQVLAESGHWREVEDWEGTRGWVHKDLLSSRRMARVSENWVEMQRQPRDGERPLAELARGVLAELKSCQGDWCIIEVDNIAGWLPRADFFGTYSHEDFS